MTENHDHDLLIRVDENVKNLIKDVKDMRDNVSGRLNDQDTRIDRLEKWQAWSKGLTAVFSVVIALVVYIYLSDIRGIKDELSKHEVETQQNIQQLLK